MITINKDYLSKVISDWNSGESLKTVIKRYKGVLPLQAIHQVYIRLNIHGSIDEKRKEYIQKRIINQE